MTTIRNATKKPLNVPLPQGKRLFLTPGKTGDVAPKHLEHPPIAALVEAGDIEVVGGGGGKSGGGSSKSTSSQRMREGGVRRFGDG